MSNLQPNLLCLDQTGNKREAGFEMKVEGMIPSPLLDRFAMRDLAISKLN